MTLEIWIAVVGVGIMCMYVVWLNGSRAKKTHEKVEFTVNEAIKNSMKKIDEAISPHVTFCSSIEQVRTEAAHLIVKAADSFKRVAEQNAENHLHNEQVKENLSDYFITIYGSANLAAGNDPEDASLKEYKNAVHKADSSQIQFRRYISIISRDELKTRSKPVQEDYINWLGAQFSEIQNDPNYTLIISPRAPQWGSSNTTFMSRDGLIEVKGSGRAAIVINDQRIAIRMRYSMRSDIYKSLPANRNEINRANQKSIQWLDDEIKKTKCLLDER